METPSLMKPVADKQSDPIFVVGCPRSGTTLVGRILDRHEEIYTPGESHYFDDVWARRGDLGPLTSRESLSRAADRLLTVFGRFRQQRGQTAVDEALDRDRLIERGMALGGGYGGIYLAFMGLLAESRGARRTCDDTPRHLFYLNIIFELFPTAKVIACVRDPRDFLSSYKNYWKVVREPDRVKALYHPVITSLLWRSSQSLLATYAKQCGPTRVIIIRYERLVAAPQTEIARICAFLGVGYSDHLAEVQKHNSTFEEPRTGIFTHSVGRWREHLTVEEAWWVQILNRRLMERFGYQPERIRPKLLPCLWQLATAPSALARALAANTHRHGPTIPYLMRRLLGFVTRHQ